MDSTLKSYFPDYLAQHCVFDVNIPLEDVVREICTYTTKIGITVVPEIGEYSTKQELIDFLRNIKNEMFRNCNKTKREYRIKTTYIEHLIEYMYDANCTFPKSWR